MSQKIGILVHGRHVETAGWARLVWGVPPHELGVLPMMILVALNRGVENIGTVIFGTGASRVGELFESEFMKQYFLQNFERLREFVQINGHAGTLSLEQIQHLRVLVSSIICETTSQNTVQEIAAAAKIFTEAGVTEVIQITCASHAPRCLKDAAVAAEQGLIPTEQMWSVVRDQMTYAGTSASDVAIFEPPHRGDDPMIDAAIKPHEVFPLLYKISQVDAKVEALMKIEAILRRAVALAEV